MPAPTNLSFELLGPLVGQARGWQYREQSRVFVCGFARNAFLGGGLSRPHELDHADWTASQVVVVANAEDSPDGAALTAERLTDTAVNALHFVRRTAAIAFANEKSYTFGFFARKSVIGAGIDKVGMYLDLGAGEYAYSCFDIFGGNEVNHVANLYVTAGGTSKIPMLHGEINYFIPDAVSGEVWCLCSTSFAVRGSLSLQPAILLNPPTAGALTTYLGTGKHIDVWGAFLVEGSLAAEEDFEVAWGNDGFIETMILGTHTQLAVFPSVPFPDTKNEEDFEELWLNTPFLTSLGSVVASTFDTVPEDREDFEEEWGNVPYLLVLAGPTAATFDGLAENFDDFEEEWGGGVDKNAIVTAGGGSINFVGHPFFNGQRVKFISSGVLPAPLREDTEYFVYEPQIDSFKLTLTPEAPLGPIDIASLSMGTHLVCWTAPSPGPVFTVDTGTWVDLILGFGHGISDGAVLTLGSSVLLPNGLVAGTRYYVVGATSTRIRLSLTLGGSTAIMGDAGTGIHFLLTGHATFDGATSGAMVEDFEEVILDKTFTVDAGTDVFTSNGHGLANGTTVYVLPPAGGAFPAGLNPTVRYFIVATAANTFQLSLTSGGAAVNVTDAGVGVQRVRADAALYWNEAGFNPTL